MPKPTPSKGKRPRQRRNRPMSPQQYASHRAALRLPGGTLAAVQNALNEGRIDVNDKGMIDPATADAAWAGNTRPRVDYSAPAEGGEGKETYGAARERKERAAADREEMKRDQEAGRLVLVDDIAARWAQLAATVKDRLMAWAPRLAPALAGKSQRDIRTRLDEEVRKVLRELAGPDDWAREAS